MRDDDLDPDGVNPRDIDPDAAERYREMERRWWAEEAAQGAAETQSSTSTEPETPIPVSPAAPHRARRVAPYLLRGAAAVVAAGLLFAAGSIASGVTHQRERDRTRDELAALTGEQAAAAERVATLERERDAYRSAAAQAVAARDAALAQAADLKRDRDTALALAADLKRGRDAARAAAADCDTERTRLADKNERLDLEAKRLRAIVGQAAGLLGSSSPIRSISFVGAGGDADAAVAEGDVEVSVHNDFLPCRLIWKTDKGEKSVDVPVGDSTFKLPAGKVRITCEPGAAAAWYQPFGVVHKNRFLGTSLGPVVIAVNADDQFRVRMEQPFAPWNSTTVRIKGVWAVVALEVPWAERFAKEFMDGKYPGKEELPNAAMFWSRDGTKGMAEELAKYFVAHRGDKGHAGRFRGAKHTSLIVPLNATGVVPPLEKITEAELAAALTEAFEALRKQRPPIGRTVEQEIARGAELLKAIAGKKK